MYQKSEKSVYINFFVKVIVKKSVAPYLCGHGVASDMASKVDTNLMLRVHRRLRMTLGCFMNLRGYLIGDDKTFVFSSLETRKAGGDLIVVFNINFDNIKSGNGWSATIAGYFTEKGVFIARQHTNPRY